MAARRGKSQARRNPGSGGLPGWAWALIGALVAVVLILVVPKWLDSDKPDFLRPQPNPDAQPAPASEEPLPAPAVDGSDGDGDKPEYDFYTLLPGREVPVSDAELAAQERAERERTEAAAQPADDAGDDDRDDAGAALPQPVDRDAVDQDNREATAGDGSRYLLQAGSFENPRQAEALKARIALLGLSARVVPATIDGRTVHRVQMGPYASATALADAKRKLADGGLPALAIKVK